MPQDSTGKLIKIGDTVRFRGEEYTIKAFAPGAGMWGVAQIIFNEEQHVKDIADEITVDLVRRAK